MKDFNKYKKVAKSFNKEYESYGKNGDSVKVRWNTIREKYNINDFEKFEFHLKQTNLAWERTGNAYELSYEVVESTNWLMLLIFGFTVFVMSLVTENVSMILVGLALLIGSYITNKLETLNYEKNLYKAKFNRKTYEF